MTIITNTKLLPQGTKLHQIIINNTINNYYNYKFKIASIRYKITYNPN